MDGDKATYTPKEAATIWEVSDQTVYRWIEGGIIQAENQQVSLFRKRYTIPASEIQRIHELLEQRRRGNTFGHLANA